jgi:fructokinase
MVHSWRPGCSIIDVEPLTEGLRNANFKVQVKELQEPIVLRIYEHDASICQKEIDLLRLAGSVVPVPEVIYAEPQMQEGVPAYMWMRYVNGISFHQLKRQGDAAALAQAAHSAGEVLAALSCITFERAGWLGPGPVVVAPLFEGPDPMPRFVDLCLASTNLQRAMPAELRERTQAWVWSHASELAALAQESRLVHGDFNKRNLLVQEVRGTWSVAALLDWEFAVSGSPLSDLGSFLRYERTASPIAEPHFSSGYLSGGGALPRGWRDLARLIDLTSLCESLTHDHLPGEITSELVELVHAKIGVETRIWIDGDGSSQEQQELLFG